MVILGPGSLGPSSRLTVGGSGAKNGDFFIKGL